MIGFDRARHRLVYQLPRPSDFTQYPVCVSQEAPCGTGIRAEAEFGFTIALRIISFQRLLQILFGFRKIALKETGHAQVAAGNRRFSHQLRAYRFVPEGHRSLPRQAQIAAQ